MLELQRDLGALLRNAALFEGVSKLVRFSDSQKKLGLSHKIVGLHAVPFGGSGQCGEVYIGSDVLFAGGFIGIFADRMLANCFECPPMAAGELLRAGVAVVDGDDKTAGDVRGNAFHILLRHEWRLEAFVSFWMN